MSHYYDTGAVVAEQLPFGSKKWAANSQYGYEMAEFNTEAEAIAFARAYYTKRPKLTGKIMTEKSFLAIIGGDFEAFVE